MPKRLLSIVLGLIGLGLSLVTLFGALMLMFPPVQPPPGVQPECCLQYAPLLLLLPIAVLFAFGFTATCLWKNTYPAWHTNGRAKTLIVLHGLCGLVSLAVLWIWVIGVLRA